MKSYYIIAIAVIMFLWHCRKATLFKKEREESWSLSSDSNNDVAVHSKVATYIYNMFQYVVNHNNFDMHDIVSLQGKA